MKPIINKKNPEIVLFFNGRRGIEIFKYLKKKKYLISQIYLSKKFLNKNIIDELKKNNIKYKIISSLNKIKFNKFSKSIGIVCGFPYIFKQKQIKSFFKIINCHAGRLPNYRGGSPLSWQMINGEKFFGITVLYLTPQIDAGNILAEKKFNLKDFFLIDNLHYIANNNFPKMVALSIKKILKGNRGKKQSTKNVRYYSQRHKRDSKILLKKFKFLELSRYVRALQGEYPRAFFFYKGNKISINSIRRSNKNLKPGEIRKINSNFYVGCKDSSILIRQT